MLADMSNKTRPQALAHCPPAQWAQVCGVMTDIDDTLTRDGQIEPVALAALHNLAAAGLPVVAVTGRPLGWSRPFAQAWPVQAIVAENGAVALVRDGANVRTEFVQDVTTRAHNQHRLQRVAQRILAEVPGALLAQDSAGRETDIAIDHSEFTSLPDGAMQQAVDIMQSAGLTATVSSIHINGWLGTHNKWTGAQWMVRRLFGRALDQEVGRWVYVGDSTNDQLMFERFALSVGVANLLRFEAQLHTWPIYITQAERGAGFAEVVQALLRARTHP
jgi:HAD superfamily hydrolase (TIGR01484 family)